MAVQDSRCYIGRAGAIQVASFPTRRHSRQRHVSMRTGRRLSKLKHGFGRSSCLEAGSEARIHTHTPSILEMRPESIAYESAMTMAGHLAVTMKLSKLFACDVQKPETKGSIGSTIPGSCALSMVETAGRKRCRLWMPMIDG